MQRVNELYAEIEQCTDDTKKLELLFDLATCLLNFDERRTQEVANELGTLAERLDDNTGRSYYHSSMGRILFRKSLFKDATREFELACEKAMLTSNVITQASCLDSLGIAYRIQGEYEKSLQAGNEALEIFKSAPNTLHYQSVCYNNLGSLYKDLNDFDKAKQMFELGLDVGKQSGETRMVCNLYNNLAGISIMAEKYDEGAVYATLALRDFRKLNHKNGEVHALVFLGHCVFGKGNYADALQHYLGCIKLLKRVDHKLVEVQAYKGLANVYAKMQAYPEALKNYNKAIKLCMQVHDYSEATEVYLQMANMYMVGNELKLAEQYLQEARILCQEHRLMELAQKVEHVENALHLRTKEQ